jgi:hypothetical protein
MSKKGYLKGPKLFSLARKKALQFDLPQTKGIKLAELICGIQEKEGHQPCFQRREVCHQRSCCWQASCSARMMAE